MPPEGPGHHGRHPINRREWLQVGFSSLLGLSLPSLLAVRAQTKLQLFAFTVMPDHAHLLLAMPGDGTPLSTVIGRWKFACTKSSWDLGYAGGSREQRREPLPRIHSAWQRS